MIWLFSRRKPLCINYLFLSIWMYQLIGRNSILSASSRHSYWIHQLDILLELLYRVPGGNDSRFPFDTTQILRYKTTLTIKIRLKNESCPRSNHLLKAERSYIIPITYSLWHDSSYRIHCHLYIISIMFRIIIL